MADPIPDVEELSAVFRDPGLLIGIPLALAGAVFMSLGTQYQNRGVLKVESMSGEDAGSGLSGGQLMRLLTRPSWVIGTLLLALAIVCQLAALWKAPLIVVQPLGAVALVITTLLNARVSGHAPTRRSIIAISLCVGGVFIFVTLAALVAKDRAVDDFQLMTVLVILLVTIIVMGGLWILLRKRAKALFYIMCAGIVYGFVATLAKVVIKRIQAGDFEWLTLVCLIALLAGTAVGGYFVQTAHASGPPDLVIAGLTVIDPIVAVLIGMLVLGEAADAPVPILIGFAVAGAIATYGVIELARFHPQVMSESQELPIERGSDADKSEPAAPTSQRNADDAAAQPVSRTHRDEPFDDGPIVSDR